MSYYTRVLSKDEEFPSFDELAQFVRAEHPQFKLTLEEGTEEEWESLLLSGNDDVEVAVIERNPVSEGSVGEDDRDRLESVDHRFGVGPGRPVPQIILDERERMVDLIRLNHEEVAWLQPFQSRLERLEFASGLEDLGDPCPPR